MKRSGQITLGVVIALLGAVFTLQGLGFLAGSVMTGVTFWAIVGPILVLIGLVVALRAARSGGAGQG